MKSLNLLSVAIGLVLSFSTHAVSLATDKLKTKAKTALENSVGKHNLEGDGEIWFRDGAGSTNLEPLFDYAAFVYVVTPKADILPEPGLKLGYRLLLNGNEDIVFFSRTDQGQLLISLPGEGVATLNPQVSKAEVNEFIAKLSQLSPAGDFQHLDEVGALSFKVPILDAKKIFTELRQSKLVKTVELNYEAYRIPFGFDPVLSVQDTGKIDADKYRQMTKKFKSQGLRFSSETTVPEDLQ